ANRAGHRHGHELCAADAAQVQGKVQGTRGREQGYAALSTLSSEPLIQPIGNIAIDTRGDDFVDIRSRVADWLREKSGCDGLLTLFLKHTSASLTIQENADPDVRADLATALGRLAPDDAGWTHTIEGPDDMPAHVKTMLTGVNLAIPV